jgi:pectin methylesterase-like acyl-CoA thioesterase
MRRVVVLAVVASALVMAPVAGAKVLLVGTYHGVRGKYSSIQAAVDAARSGDWILVAPGDYKTTSSRHPRGRADESAGVLVTKPHIWIVGMNRNTVIVDGTKSGPACSTSAADQNLGPKLKGKAQGLNGIMVWKAANVSVENLTVCNFLNGSGDAGNEIWWNGGDGGGKVGGHGMWGSYLTATTKFYNG